MSAAIDHKPDGLHQQIVDSALQVERGHSSSASQAGDAPLAWLQFAHRTREAYLRSAVALNNQIKAIERIQSAELSGAILGDLNLLHAALVEQVDRWGHNLEYSAIELPIWPWVKGVRGVGPLCLAQIIGEAGDLNRFSNPAKLWRWFGLAVIDGKAERRVKGQKLHFAPQNKKIAYTLAVGLRNLNKGEYRALYDSEKAKATAKGWHLEKSPTTNRAENHAMRVLAKRFLRDLWREWRTSQ